MLKKLDKRYFATEANSHFHWSHLSFEDYIAASRQMITNHRLDLDGTDAQKIIEANTPFEWRPANTKRCDNGILLLHGLYNSPYQMHDLGRYYLEQGFLVRSVLLPGHGTVPGDLLNVNYDQWIKAAEYGINSFKGQVNNLYVAGFSTGALLGLYHALHNKPIKGVILLAAALKIKTRLDFILNWHHAISWLVDKAKWFNFAADKDWAKYESLCFNSAYQVHKLSKKIIKLNQKSPIHTPLFFVLSEDDEVINPYVAMHFFHKQANPKNKMLLYSNHQLHPHDDRIKIKPAAVPEQNIIDLSHPCIPISPSNSHYGIKGDYCDQQHYDKFWGKFYRRNCSQKLSLGATSIKNIKHYHLQRLMYNPHFDEMVSDIDAFMASIS